MVGISVKNGGFLILGDPVKWHWASTIHDMRDDGYMGGSNMANMGYQRSLTVFFGWMEDFVIYAQQGFINDLYVLTS